MVKKFVQQSSVENFWDPIVPIVLGELVTVDHDEEFSFADSTLAATFTVRPGEIMIVTRISEEGIICALLLGEREIAPHPVDHPTFVRVMPRVT